MPLEHEFAMKLTKTFLQIHSAHKLREGKALSSFAAVAVSQSLKMLIKTLCVFTKTYKILIGF